MVTLSLLAWAAIPKADTSRLIADIHLQSVAGSASITEYWHASTVSAFEASPITTDKIARIDAEATAFPTAATEWTIDELARVDTVADAPVASSADRAANE